mmetsp:Transcript_7366/g.16088  ORF Transcript_7366/g.16088 Transcript_7366/m.16088 type:complete len:416 (+) Transcript_7366:39-1286(+)
MRWVERTGPPEPMPLPRTFPLPPQPPEGWQSTSASGRGRRSPSNAGPVPGVETSAPCPGEPHRCDVATQAGTSRKSRLEAWLAVPGFPEPAGAADHMGGQSASSSAAPQAVRSPPTVTPSPLQAPSAAPSSLGPEIVFKQRCLTPPRAQAPGGLQAQPGLAAQRPAPAPPVPEPIRRAPPPPPASEAPASAAATAPASPKASSSKVFAPSAAASQSSQSASTTSPARAAGAAGMAWLGPLPPAAPATPAAPAAPPQSQERARSVAPAEQDELFAKEVQRIHNAHASDWTRILGISRGDEASIQVAKSRYRQSMKLLHPDKRTESGERRAGGKEVCDSAMHKLLEAVDMANKQARQVILVPGHPVPPPPRPAQQPQRPTVEKPPPPPKGEEGCGPTGFRPLLPHRDFGYRRVSRVF